MAGIIWTVIAALVLFWVLGLAFHVTTGLIHLLLVVAAILFVINMFTGRTTV